MLNHKHLIIKAEINRPPTDITLLNDWFVRLVDKVGMKILMGPYSIYLNDPGNRGITGMVGITTSHASVHIWDEVKPAVLQMDVYSCKDFNIADVLEMLKEFDVVKSEYLVLDRNKSIEVVDGGS